MNNLVYIKRSPLCIRGLFISSKTNLPHNFLQCFSGGKSRGFSRRNVYRGTRLRIPPDSGFTAPYHECPKSGDDYFVTFPNTAPTASLEAFAVRLAFFATTSIKSAFVILLSPPIGQKDRTRRNFQKHATAGSMRQCRRCRAFCQDIS